MVIFHWFYVLVMKSKKEITNTIDFIHVELQESHVLKYQRSYYHS